MSTATDLAELEAAIAEHELEETAAARLRELLEEGAELPQAIEQVLAERDGQAPPPELPQAAEEPLGEPSDKQLRELDREQARHLAKAHAIMGPHLEGFTECEKCDGLGLTPPGPSPQSHPYFIACDTCNGFGEVFTGSLREGRTSRDCPACGGYGYLEALGEGGTPLAEGGRPIGSPAVTPPEAQLAQLEPEGERPAPTLTHGRPAWMGDPNIGR